MQMDNSEESNSVAFHILIGWIGEKSHFLKIVRLQFRIVTFLCIIKRLKISVKKIKWKRR